MSETLEIIISSELDGQLDIDTQIITDMTMDISENIEFVKSEYSSSDYAKSHVYANTHYDFPNLGTSESLYIAKDEASIYRWDEENLTYFLIGMDYSKISNITGGNSNG